MESAFALPIVPLASFPHWLASQLGRPLRWLFGIFVSTVHGDARFMTGAERKRFLSPRNKGLWLGPAHRLSRADSFRNLALIAPTGSGKTSRFIVPNVLGADGSVVVTDPSGEIFRLTSGHLNDRGYRIQVLQPNDVVKSVRFNPLAFWNTTQQLRQLAVILAGSASTPQSEPFWTSSATNVLFFSLAAIKAVEDRRFVNLANLRWLLNHLDSESKAIDAFMAHHLNGTGLPSSLIHAEYQAFRSMDGRVRSNILATARASIDLWSDPAVCQVTAENTLDIASLRKAPTAIYLILPEHQVGYFGVLANLFYSTCFAHCLESGLSREELPVYFLMDEFGNLGHITDAAMILTTLRKRRCSVSLVLQEASQLRATYGVDTATTILSGGAANRLFFGGVDLETAEYVEQILGETTVYETTFGGISEAAHTLEKPLLSADEVRRLGPQDAILVSGAERPAQLRMPPFFEVPALDALSKKLPVELEIGGDFSSPKFLDFEKSQVRLRQQG